MFIAQILERPVFEVFKPTLDGRTIGRICDVAAELAHELRALGHNAIESRLLHTKKEANLINKDLMVIIANAA